MNTFFKPAIVLMNNLKYPKKLFLIGSISTLAVIILTIQLVFQAKDIIEFSNRELLGVEYINPLIKVMEDLQHYRKIDNAYLMGDESVKNDLISSRENIDRAIGLFEKNGLPLGNTLKINDDWTPIKEKWQSMKNPALSTSQKSDLSNYTALIASIQALIVTACDKSNLTLDPDIDSYYLMDTYCTKLPAFSEQTALIHDLGNKSLKNKVLSGEDSKEIIINRAVMNQFNKIGIRDNFDKTLDANSSLRPIFDPLVKAFLLQADYYVHLLDTTFLANNFNLSPATLSHEAAKLLHLTNNLHSNVATSLYKVIHARVQKNLSSLYMNLSIATFSLLILIYLFIGIYFSIVSSVRNLNKGSEKLAAGDLTATVELETKDELVQVASSFNRMRDILSKIINEIQFVVSNEMNGDLEKRITLNEKEGFYKDLSITINKGSDIFQSVIKEAIYALNNISQGNLTTKITNHYQGAFDDLKIAINTTVERLEKLIQNIKSATETINKAAEEIALGNNDLAKRTEQQAAFLEETAASMEQFTATVKQNAANATQANQFAQSSSEVATKSGAVMKEVITTMTAINESSRKVTDIITVIDEIAFQTNILALNAAVEAARAGEQGRGFAVVATEVRNLAQRTSDAAKEIKDLITKSVDNVTSGTKLVDQAGHTMEDLVKAVSRVTEIMSEIATASTEQSTGIEQVNQAVIQMDQVTQQNSIMVEKAANSAQSMKTQALHMDRLVNIFKITQNTLSSTTSGQAATETEEKNSETKNNKGRDSNQEGSTKYKNTLWEEF